MVEVILIAGLALFLACGASALVAPTTDDCPLSLLSLHFDWRWRDRC
jgi:hypothetical protein